MMCSNIRMYMRTYMRTCVRMYKFEYLSIYSTMCYYNRSTYVQYTQLYIYVRSRRLSLFTGLDHWTGILDWLIFHFSTFEQVLLFTCLVSGQSIITT